MPPLAPAPAPENTPSAVLATFDANIERVTRPLLQFLSQASGIDTVYFTHIDWQQGQQRILFLHNSSALPLQEGMDIPLHITLCERAIEQQHFFEAHVDAVWQDKQAAMQLGIKTYASAPVEDIDNSIYGTLCAISQNSVPLSADKRQLFSLCADIISRQIEREYLVAQLQQDQEVLRELALVDELTGVFNRRALDIELAHMVGKAQRLNLGLFLAFIDLDGFKRINDTWGHAAGDAMLREVSVRLKKTLRSGDVVGRYGGDEFIALGLLRNRDDISEGHALQKRLANALSGHYQLPAHTLDYAGPSIGWIEAWDDALDATALMTRADHAMYQAKQARKDQSMAQSRA